MKALYRTLAKRLHPDRSSVPESLRAKRWHELQEAYEQEDFEAIRRIEAVCDMDESGISVDLGLARLRELADYHRSHLGPIRRALKEAKRHLAFGFAGNGPDAIRGVVAGDIEETVEELEDECAALEQATEALRREISGFAGPARRSSRRSRKRPAENPHQFELFT